MDFKRYLRKICTICKKGNSSFLYDCEDNEILSISNQKVIYSHSGKKDKFSKEELKTIRYFRTVNDKFRKNYYAEDLFYLSSVWLLIGIKDKEEILLQVGRSKSSVHMLTDDIAVDARYIIEGGDNNYASLDFDILSFYQIDIDSYLNETNDQAIFEILREKAPDDPDLKSAYYRIKAAYVEGKIAALRKAKIWNPSGGMDGDFYHYNMNHKSDMINY